MKLHQCNIQNCGQSFCSDDHLSIHLNCHKTHGNIFQCQDCGKYFHKKEELEEHNLILVFFKSMMIYFILVF